MLRSKSLSFEFSELDFSWLWPSWPSPDPHLTWTWTWAWQSWDWQLISEVAARHYETSSVFSIHCGIGRHSTVNNCGSKSKRKWIFETFFIYVLKLHHISIHWNKSLMLNRLIWIRCITTTLTPQPSCQISAKKKWARQKLMRNSLHWTRKILQVKHMTLKTILRGHASWALGQTIFKKGKNKIKSLKKLGIKLGISSIE